MMFRTSGEYFLSLLKEVGGMNEYVTEFVTQAFYFPFGAPVVIALLLGSMAGLFYLFLQQCGAKATMWLALLPAFLCWVFPVESIAVLLAAIGALASAVVYASVANKIIRYVTGFVLLTACYILAVPAHLLLALLLVVYEWCTAKGKMDYLIPLIGLAWALVLPLIAMRTLYVIPMREAFLSKHLYHPQNPVPESFWLLWASFPIVTLLAYGLRKKEFVRNERLRWVVSLILLVGVMTVGILTGGQPLEQVYRYDYYARHDRWQDIVDHSLTHGVRDQDALVYVNLANAKTGQFNERLFQLPQIGEDGLIPYDPKGNLGLIEAAEVSWYLNHINATYRLAFEGILSGQRLVQPRLAKRVVEACLVNEEYAVAAKYIKLLESTLLYRPWALQQRALLDKAVAGQTEWVAAKRQWRSTTDNIYDIVRTFPSTLAYMLDDHADNQPASEYALAYLLMNKDLGTFLHYAELWRDQGKPIPVLYQEALCLIYATMRDNPEEYRSYAIDAGVYERFVRFAQAARNLPQAALQQQYGDTYYYYAQYVPTPKSVQR